MKSARHEILDKLKNAVYTAPEKPDFDAPVYHSIDIPLEIAFKESLKKVNGSVYIFQNKKELFKELKQFLAAYKPANVFCLETEIQSDLDQFEIPFSKNSKLPKSIEIGITGCEFLIAHTGSAMISSAQKGGRQLFIYPPIHIIIAKKNQVVEYLDAAYMGIQKKYKNKLPSQISLITGPSRTADIEKTLILGAHGPKELHVFLLNE